MTTATDETLMAAPPTDDGASSGSAASIDIPDYMDDIPSKENFDAPEGGSFAPRLYPGKYRFRFEMTPVYDRATKQPIPGGLGSVVVNGETFPQMQYTAHLIADGVAEADFTNGRFEGEAPVPFQTASAYVTKRGISGIGELCRTLGFQKVHGRDPKGVGEMLRWLKSVSGTATGTCEIGWRIWDKSAEREINTNPNPKRKRNGKPSPDQPWPTEMVNGKKRPTLTVTLGDQQFYGRETVVNLLRG